MSYSKPPISAALAAENTSNQTDRKNAEEELIRAKEALELKTEALEKSLATVRATLESTADGILVTDVEGRITDFNNRYLEMWNLPRSLIEEERYKDFLTAVRSQLKHPQGYRRRILELNDSSVEEAFDTMELKNGRVYERVSKLQVVNGRRMGRVWSIHDVTERIRAEKTLRDEARLLQMMNETGASLASKLDVCSVARTVTNAATELTGAEYGAFFYLDQGQFTLYALAGTFREQFSGMQLPGVDSRLDPDFFARSAPTRSQDIAENPPFEQDRKIPELNPPVRSYLATPVVSGSGQVIGSLFCGHSRPRMFDERSERIIATVASQAAIAMDNAHLYEAAQHELAERKRAEQALKASGQRLRFMAETMPQKIFTADAHGTFDYLNQQWLEFTGLSFEEIREGGWKAVLHPADANNCHWERSVRTGTPFQCEHRLRAADGRYRWHLTRAHPMRNEAGEILMWTGSNTDIDDIKRSAEERKQILESERAARMEVERVSAIKDEFLATLSHELRTPLNAILGWANVLQLRRSDPAIVDEGLQAIERNVKVQSQLIEDLLDMNRIKSGKLRLDIGTVNPVTVVRAAIDTVRATAEAKNLHLEVSLDPAVDSITADGGRLQQILWNLLSNAIKFTPEGGDIRVSMSKTDSHVEIRVADTGVGIEAEFLPYVFERFRQADSSTARKFGGLGLGLSIVKHLVQMHGGKISVESAGKGKGSTFVISLPATEAVGNEEAPARNGGGRESHRPDLEGIHVMVVDDEPDARLLIQRLLEEYGAKVTTASCGSEALALLQGETPDVLVSDIGMPEMDGYEFLKNVRILDGASGHVPAVALTAFARPEDRTRALQAGFLVHISKPVEPAELMAVIGSVVGKNAEALA